MYKKYGHMHTVAGCLGDYIALQHKILKQFGWTVPLATESGGRFLTQISHGQYLVAEVDDNTITVYSRRALGILKDLAKRYENGYFAEVRVIAPPREKRLPPKSRKSRQPAVAAAV